MDITISRKKTMQLGFGLVLVAMLIGLGLWARNNGLDRFLVAEQQAETSNIEPPLRTVSIIYAPDLKSGRETWYEEVCEGMSIQGCELFKDVYGPSLWNALEAGIINPIEAQAVLLEEVETYKDGRQVWKVGFTVLDGPETRETQDVPNPPQEISGEIYIEVSREQGTGHWLLDRILFEEEVKARYGA